MVGCGSGKPHAHSGTAPRLMVICVHALDGSSVHAARRLPPAQAAASAIERTRQRHLATAIPRQLRRLVMPVRRGISRPLRMLLDS